MVPSEGRVRQRRAALLVAVFAFSASIASVGLAQATEDDATIRVVTRPADATVVLQGTEVTVTPASGQEVRVPAGVYVLRVTADGYEPLDEVVMVQVGSQTHHVELRSASSAAAATTGALQARDGWRYVVVGVLGVALIVVIGYLLYLYRIQRRYYRLLECAVCRDGVDLKVGQTPATYAARVQLTDAATKPLTIRGPLSVRLGGRPAVFEIVEKEDDSGKSLAGFSWSVEPAGNAVVSPAPDGLSARVAVSAVGSYKVRATSDDYAGEAVFVALPAEDNAEVEIPWVGEGYGAVIVSVFILGTVLILAYVGAVEGAVVGTVLGALAGYIFGKR